MSKFTFIDHILRGKTLFPRPIEEEKKVLLQLHSKFKLCPGS